MLCGLITQTYKARKRTDSGHRRSHPRIVNDPHFAVNIGMTIGLFPVIGIPLPFFSYGGSSLWAFTILLFGFLKLDAHRLQLLQR